MVVLGISSQDFWSLTPVQLSIAFHLKKVQKQEELNFSEHLTRLINFYTFISANGSKKVRTPKDLYKLSFENQSNELTEEQKEFLLQPITEEEQEIIRKLTT